MAEVYITIDEAAKLAGLSYKCLSSRIQRNPSAYDTKPETREGVGRPRLLVSVSCLTPRAQQLYWTEQAKPLQRRMADEATKGKGTPWYVEADYIAFHDLHNAEFMAALETLQTYRPLLSMTQLERAEAVKRLAKKTGETERTIYNRYEALREAQAWAFRKEEETGYGYDMIYMPMALCRKPREKGLFYTLTEIQRKKIASIWFRKGFVENEPSMRLAYQIYKEESPKEGLPEVGSYATVKRFIRAMMKDPLTAQAHYYAAKGARKFEANMVMKQRRNTKALDVLELVQGDGHTCDLWVQVTDENGKKRAIRPTLVCWIDTRSRVPMGYVMCEHANSRIIKQSLIKMAYGTPGGVPKGLLIDNGKDFTAKSLTGQSRSVRTRQEINRALDAELNGFMTQLGIQKYTRALPYHAWIKGQMERFFGTVIEQFEKRFPSYTGTLTGSRTAAKIEKNIGLMLKRGELPTLEEFQQKFEDWLQTVYLMNEHGGLKEQREEWVTPLEVFAHAPRYAKAVPPKDYAQVLCMETGQATVRKDGILKFGTVYVATELCRHIGRKVNIRFERDDLAELHIYDPATAEKICVAVSHEFMGMADRVSLDDLEALMRRRNAHKRDVRGRSAELREAYTFKCERADATPEVVGGIELGKQPAPKVASLPEDKEYRRESIRNARGAGARRGARNGHPDFIMQVGDEALDRMFGNTAEG